VLNDRSEQRTEFRIRNLPFVVAGLAVFFLSAVVTTPANACLFVGINPVTKETASAIHSRSFGATETGACRRAERACLRKLRAAWKSSKVQQFACKRID
jgi:hypothetical protein